MELGNAFKVFKSFSMCTHIGKFILRHYGKPLGMCHLELLKKNHFHISFDIAPSGQDLPPYCSPFCHIIHIIYNDIAIPYKPWR